MARRKSNASTTIPAVRHLRYHLTNSGSAGTETSHFIDLAKDLSALNRRLYRQGRSYHVRRVTVVSSNTVCPPQATAGRISMSCAPNSWTARGAWNRGLKTYNLMNKEATHNLTNNISGKWHDFKIYLTNAMYAGTTLVPIDNGNNAPTSGEWNYSEYVSPDGTTSEDTFRIHLMGDSDGSVGAWNSVGLIESFGATRATVDSDQPNVPGDASDDPLLNVFDYGTTIDEVIDKLEAENDNPPYDLEDYPGAETNAPEPVIVQYGAISNAEVDGRVGGFVAPCGLLEIEIKGYDQDGVEFPRASMPVIDLLLHVAPGMYKGVASVPMGQ